MTITGTALARAGGGGSWGGGGYSYNRSYSSNRIPGIGDIERLVPLQTLGAIALLIGIPNCFFGYRIFKILLGLFGFFVGAIIGLAIAGAGGAEQGALILAALVGGALGAALMIALYFLGVFLVGAGAGIVLGGVLLNLGGIESSTGAVVFFGLAGGVLAVMLQRTVIIIATAFQGGSSMAFGIAVLSGGMQYGAYVALLLALSIGGAIVQFKVTGIQGKWSGRNKPIPLSAATAAQDAPPGGVQ